MKLYIKFLALFAISLTDLAYSGSSIIDDDEDPRLTNKVVLITGASGDIGRGIARKFLQETDAFLILQYNQNQNALKSMLDEVNSIAVDRIFLVHADFSNPVNAEHLFDNALTWKQKIDIVINSCGIEKECTSLQDKLEITQLTNNVNYMSPMMVDEYAVNFWIETQIPGIIINLGSRAAYRGLSEELSHYSESKASLHSHTMRVAKNHAHQNILAYIIAPGPVEGNMLDQNPKHLKQLAIDSMLTKKVVAVREIANIALFYAQRKAPNGTGGCFDLMGASFPH